MEKWLNNVFEQKYNRIKVLKKTEKSEVSLWMHRKLEQKIIRRVYKGEGSVYNKLLNISYPGLSKIF